MLEYVKPYLKGSEIYRFSCSATQNFLRRPTTVAGIFNNFEPPSKKYLTTPIYLNELQQQTKIDYHTIYKEIF